MPVNDNSRAETPRQRARHDLSHFGSRRPLASRLVFGVPAAALAAFGALLPETASIGLRVLFAGAAACVGVVCAWVALYAYFRARAPGRLLAEIRTPLAQLADDRVRVRSVLSAMLEAPGVDAPEELVVAWRKNCERFIRIALGYVEARMFTSCRSVNQAHDWIRRTIDTMETKPVWPGTFTEHDWLVGHRGPEGLRSKPCRALEAEVASELLTIRDRVSDLGAGVRPEPPLPTESWAKAKPVLGPILSVLDLERLQTTYHAIDRVNRAGLDPPGTGGSWHCFDLAPPLPPGSGRAMPRLDIVSLQETVEVGLRSMST